MLAKYEKVSVSAIFGISDTSIGHIHDIGIGHSVGIATSLQFTVHVACRYTGYLIVVGEELKTEEKKINQFNEKKVNSFSDEPRLKK